MERHRNDHLQGTENTFNASVKQKTAVGQNRNRQFVILEVNIMVFRSRGPEGHLLYALMESVNVF